MKIAKSSIRKWVSLVNRNSSSIMNVRFIKLIDMSVITWRKVLTFSFNIYDWIFEKNEKIAIQKYLSKPGLHLPKGSF